MIINPEPDGNKQLLTRHPAASDVIVFFFNDTATTEIYTLSLHDALPISNCWPSCCAPAWPARACCSWPRNCCSCRSEEHTSELQSLKHLVCRLLLEKKRHADRLDTVLDQPS